MTRRASALLAAAVLLALIVGALVNYCVQRRGVEIERMAPPTSVVIVLPTASPAPIASLASPSPTLPERLPATMLPTATATATPEPTPLPPARTPTVERSPVQRG